MNLETDSGVKSFNVAEADLRALFADGATFGDFVILSAADGQFIQAHEIWDEQIARSYARTPYVLEYRDGTPSLIYQATTPVEKAQLLEALLDYLHGGTAWRDGRQWKKVAF